MKRFMALLVSCGSWLTAMGQTEQVQKQPVRLFVGAQAFESHYEVIFPSSPNDTRAGAWQITAGVYVSPRLVLQLGYTRTRESQSDDPTNIGTSLSGQHLDGSSYTKRATDCLPLLARYTVVGYSHTRLQIDGILGLCLLKTTEASGAENRVNGQVVSSRYTNDKATQLYAVGGIGFRYPFGQHLEGVFDWTYSRNFHTSSEAVHLSVTGNKWGLTRALSLGLRYRFVVKKKAAASTGS